MKPMNLKHFSPWALRMKVTTWDLFGRPQQQNFPTGLVDLCRVWNPVPLGFGGYEVAP